MIEFAASAVAFTREDDHDVELLVLAENRDGSGQRIEIQRGLAFDNQDRELGMDTYCVVDHSGATHYGGIASWRVEVAHLELNLTPAGQAVMGVDGYRITLGDAASAAYVARALEVLVR